MNFDEMRLVHGRNCRAYHWAGREPAPRGHTTAPANGREIENRHRPAPFYKGAERGVSNRG